MNRSMIVALVMLLAALAAPPTTAAGADAGAAASAPTTSGRGESSDRSDSSKANGASLRDMYDSVHPGIVGGALGAGIGIWGGLIGAVGGMCAPRGRAKGFVILLFVIQIVVGLMLLTIGIGALAVGTQWMTAYTFLMPGGLAVLLGVLLLPVVLARYRQAEQRRIDAEAFRAT
ncbi:MAG: hypothetical protein FJ253_05680 [Phycisphaerae bacterium]|nr:hypothetical protein [Phycisphaerae bacterium]